ncbi:hypothetical protein Barb4_02887 [Bacteroidales bacterium Barb4]|nr:hypothetical protein Barb4_02887 [Bacteroidales bacterium Barb4]
MVENEAVEATRIRGGGMGHMEPPTRRYGTSTKRYGPLTREATATIERANQLNEEWRAARLFAGRRVKILKPPPPPKLLPLERHEHSYDTGNSHTAWIRRTRLKSKELSEVQRAKIDEAAERLGNSFMVKRELERIMCRYRDIDYDVFRSEMHVHNFLDTKFEHVRVEGKFKFTYNENTGYHRSW